MLYQNILDASKEQELALVDNQDFIIWATTYGDIKREGDCNPETYPITDKTKAKFSSKYGAIPITTIDLVDKAMRKLYD